LKVIGSDFVAELKADVDRALSFATKLGLIEVLVHPHPPVVINLVFHAIVHLDHGVLSQRSGARDLGLLVKLVFNTTSKNDWLTKSTAECFALFTFSERELELRLESVLPSLEFPVESKFQRMVLLLREGCSSHGEELSIVTCLVEALNFHISCFTGFLDLSTEVPFFGLQVERSTSFITVSG